MDVERIQRILRASPSLVVAAASLGLSVTGLRHACRRGKLGADFTACAKRGEEMRRNNTSARLKRIWRLARDGE